MSHPLSKCKIAITGHTAGIGKSLFDRLLKLGVDAKGFSRSNGYDITKPEGVQKILAEIEDRDIFINNAAIDWAQLDLLYKIYPLWKDQKKAIFNIGSSSGDGDKNRVHKYAIEKAALDKATSQFNNIPDAKCRVSIIRPGWVDTPRVSHLNVTEPMLKANDIVEVVLWMMSQPRHMHVQSITLTAR